MTAETRTVELGGWDGPWDAGDPDANFRTDVALYSHVDPMATLSLRQPKQVVRAVNHLP